MRRRFMQRRRNALCVLHSRKQSCLQKPLFTWHFCKTKHLMALHLLVVNNP
jgi:aromatic ring-cleaving dioxygenase